MIALISFILLIIGAVNWFCIGILQFDFIAGLFGTQASIFSRIVYSVVGIAALVILYNLIVNKGKIIFNFKKRISNKEGEAISNENRIEQSENNAMNEKDNNSHKNEHKKEHKKED